MNEYIDDVKLDISSRHKDVQIRTQSKGHESISFTLSGGGTKNEAYKGPYSVESIANEMQIYSTENKVMTENLVVLPIPYYETSNLKGGLTVYIGGN